LDTVKIDRSKAATPALMPELRAGRDIAIGFLDGSSFLGDSNCKAAMEGVIYYGFTVMSYNQNGFDVRYAMKSAIAA
jgi:hypothetical protein